jgi:hypothetical protein
MLPYTLDRDTTEGRVVIEAAWKPYTQIELWQREREVDELIDAAQEFGK